MRRVLGRREDQTRASEVKNVMELSSGVKIYPVMMQARSLQRKTARGETSSGFIFLNRRSTLLLISSVTAGSLPSP